MGQNLSASEKNARPKRPTLLVLGAGPFQLPLIRKGKQMGFGVVATDADPSAVGLAEADFPRSTPRVRTWNSDFIRPVAFAD